MRLLDSICCFSKLRRSEMWVRRAWVRLASAVIVDCSREVMVA